MVKLEKLFFEYGWAADDAQDLADAMEREEPDFEYETPESIRAFIGWATDKAESISNMLETISCAYEDYLYDLENPADEDE